MLCHVMETVGEFSYVGDRVNADGGCEAVVTARTRCGWVIFRECVELLYSRFPLLLKGLFIAIMHDQQQSVKHGAWKKVRWKFYK